MSRWFKKWRGVVPADFVRSQEQIERAETAASAAGLVYMVIDDQ